MRLSQSSQFKRDIKKQIKRGKDLDKLMRIVQCLIDGDPLPPSAKDHPLIGNWVGRCDCHIEPDWLLIYRKTGDALHLERTGSHSDLF